MQTFTRELNENFIKNKLLKKYFKKINKSEEENLLTENSIEVCFDIKEYNSDYKLTISVYDYDIIIIVINDEVSEETMKEISNNNELIFILNLILEEIKNEIKKSNKYKFKFLLKSAELEVYQSFYKIIDLKNYNSKLDGTYYKEVELFDKVKLLKKELEINKFKQNIDFFLIYSNEEQKHIFEKLVEQDILFGPISYQNQKIKFYSITNKYSGYSNLEKIKDLFLELNVVIYTDSFSDYFYNEDENNNNYMNYDYYDEFNEMCDFLEEKYDKLENNKRYKNEKN